MKKKRNNFQRLNLETIFKVPQDAASHIELNIDDSVELVELPIENNWFEVELTSGKNI